MRDYVISICFALVLCSGVDILMPAGGYRGIVRIVCGIFVIGTIVTPIGKILSVEYSGFNPDKFFRDDYGFHDTIDTAGKAFEEALVRDGVSRALESLEGELKEITGEDMDVTLAEDVLVIDGCPADKRELVSQYIGNNTGTIPMFSD